MKRLQLFSGLRRVLLVLLLLLVCFWGYVEIINWHSQNMTARQKILKAVYPALMWWAKLRGKNMARLSHQKQKPPVSFYSLTDTLNDGSVLDFATLKGKKILLVNTASDCGYTNQYEALQKMYDENNEKLVVIAFPANDFKDQEKGSDEEIASFCKKNYGISFPLSRKSTVVKAASQHPVFQWLTDSAKNGWNSRAPSWNFTKYLVDEEGELINYFGPSVSPDSKEMIDAIRQ